MNTFYSSLPLVLNGRLANHGLTSLVKEATGITLLPLFAHEPYVIFHLSLVSRHDYSTQGLVFFRHAKSNVEVV